MTLLTKSGLPLTSPLPDSGTIGTPHSVELTDLSTTQGLVHVLGRHAEATITQVYGSAPTSPGDVWSFGEGVLARLTQDEFTLLLTSQGQVESTVERLREASGGARITITDLTHGRGQFRLSGPRAVEVLHKLCGLDFSDSAFPGLHAAQTSFAKVRALIVRLDGSKPAFHLIVDRSLAAYVRAALADAMRTSID